MRESISTLMVRPGLTVTFHSHIGRMPKFGGIVIEEMFKYPFGPSKLLPQTGK
jgi:hypothetical protein